MNEPRKDPTPKEASKESSRQVKRSPSFPFINLETAVKRAKELHDHDQDHLVAPEVAVGHWGYSAKSSGGRQTLAALRAFGLLRDEKGRVGLSGRALDIVLPGSPKRAEALEQAALEPDSFRELWEERGTSLGSLEGVRYDLLRNKGFNPNAVDDFIRSYQDSIAYAGLRRDGNASTKDRGLQEDDQVVPRDEERHLPAVGDTVQWESQGVEQFVEPQRVRALSPDGQWLFVEGSETGFPLAQVQVVRKAPREPKAPIVATAPQPPTLPLAQLPAAAQADTVMISVPFRGKMLLVQIKSQGEPLRQVHIAKVIQHLELTKDGLDPADQD